MAYVPPHRRHSKESARPLLTPELLAPQYKKNLNIKPYNKSNVECNGEIVYADHSTFRWCAIALDDENQFPSSVNLEPITLESAELNYGKNHVALINTSLINEGGEVKWNLPRSPWESITENVLEDLLSTFKHVRNEMKSAKLKEVYPTLVARVGKVLFRRNLEQLGKSIYTNIPVSCKEKIVKEVVPKVGVDFEEEKMYTKSPSVNMESIRKKLCTEISKQWNRLFYINIPVSYKEKIVNEVVPKIGVDFEEEEDTYEVQLSDSTSQDSTLFCRCRVMKEHGKLQLCEIKLNRARNMVVDISCTTKNLDLRLILYTTRLATNLTDDEMQSITDLINSAILDPDVKGGLRWSPGKESSGDKYKVVRVWHIIANTYRNASVRLEVKRTDRFDFRTLTGEAYWGTSLVLENVMSKLQEENVEASSIYEILKEDMQLIWDNFLSCERFLT